MGSFYKEYIYIMILISYVAHSTPGDAISTGRLETCRINVSIVSHLTRYVCACTIHTDTHTPIVWGGKHNKNLIITKHLITVLLTLYSSHIIAYYMVMNTKYVRKRCLRFEFLKSLTIC